MTLGFAVVVAALLSALSLLLGAGIGAVLVALLVSGALVAAAYWKSDAVVLALSRARPADLEHHARLHNVVEGLCFTSGLPKPRLYVIEDEAPNALTVGRGPRHAAVAVTTGLLSTLSPIELEGVLAHELSHVKNHDVLVSTLVATLVGMASFGFLLPRGAARRLAGLALDSGREAAADVTGVSLTRYPPGLISALEKLQAAPVPARAGSRVTAHLWIEPPADPGTTWGHADRPQGPAQGRSSLEERIEALREL